jgi:aspartyl-tRNA(Asn)/glutamyl-tRNA(Gln) amidotransferase subunit C
MAQVDAALTRRVADLARLALTDEEVATFIPQLGDVLSYVQQLAEVPVEGIEPLRQPWDAEAATPFREDVARPAPTGADGRPRVLDSAPETVSDGYKVPPVL